MKPLLMSAHHLSSSDTEKLSRAHRMAESMYEGKSSITGESLLVHAESVAKSLLSLRPDVHTLIAAMLQFARTKENLAQIEKEFGKNIRNIISALSMLDSGSSITSLNTPVQLRRLVMQLSKDIRVLLICLHNKKHVLRHSDNLEKEQREYLAREVLDVFSPICARLGIYFMKYEFETIAFNILYTKEAKRLTKMTENIRSQRGSLFEQGKKELLRLLSSEYPNVQILTREKHPYSIFRKMLHKGIADIEQIYDYFGIRIVAENVEECYAMLGVIHRIYKPIFHRIKDYIAMPKPNGYRSIHTTVLGFNKKDASMPVEIQIRTHEMDQEAEYGIAAHWNYKEGRSGRAILSDEWKQRIRALENLSTSSESHDDMSASLHEELADRIFVLTPKGDSIELSKGSTPLDFAFRIHSDIGLRFRGAKVNGAIAPINHILENGDVIEIMTWHEPKPSMQWIHMIHTKEARTKLRGFWKKKVGKEESELTASARHELRPHSQRDLSQFAEGSNHKKASTHSSVPEILLESDVRMIYRFAKCCSPEKHAPKSPPLIGCIGRKGVVNIHWIGCPMLRDAKHERFIRAEWNSDTSTRRSDVRELSRQSSET